MKSGNVAKGTVQISSTQIIQFIVYGSFFVVVTKTGALTEADLGVISVLTFLAQAILIVTSNSLAPALTKYVSENLEKGLGDRAASVQKTIKHTVFLLLTVGTGLVIALSPQISQFLWNTDTHALLIVLMCSFVYLHGLMNLYNSSLQALRLFGKVAVVLLLWVVVSRVLGALLAFLGLGIYGVLAGYVVGSGVACVTAILSAKGRLPNPAGYAPLRPILAFTFPLFLGISLNFILNWADIIFVSSLTADYARVGIYYMAVESSSFLSALWLPITYTIFPLLSGRHGLQDFHGISRILKTTTRYLAYLIVPCCVGLAVLAPVALRFLYSEAYAAGAVSFAILCVAHIFWSAFFVLTTALTAIGRTTSHLKVNVFAVLAYFAFLLLFVPSLQDTGAALARLGMLVVGFSAGVYTLGKYLRLRFDREALWKSVVSSIGMLLIMLSTQRLTAGFPVYVVMLVEILAGGCSYLLFLYVLRALSHRDFDLLRRTFQSLTGLFNFVERVMVRKERARAA